MANLTPVGVQAVVEGFSGFMSDLNKMDSGIQGVGKSFADFGGKLATAAVVTGIGAVTAAIGGLVVASKAGLDSLMGWGEQLDRLGDQFGMTGEQASVWTVAMNKVGLSVEEGGQGLNYFTRNLAAVKTDLELGNKAASPFQQSLDKLGISAFDSTGAVRSLDSLMPEIMDKFNAMPAGVNASALAMDLFGARGGTKFLDFLRQGSQGLTDAEKMAKAFGLEMSTDGMNAIESYGFALNELSLGLTGIKNQIGKAVLPYARQFVEWAKSAVPVVVQLAQALGEKLGAGLQFITTLVGSPEVKTFIDDLVVRLTNLAGVLSGALMQAFDWLNTTGFPLMRQGLDFVIQNWDAFSGALIAIGAVLAGAVIVGSIAAISAAIASLVTPVGLIIAAVGLLGAAWNTNFLGMRDAITAFWSSAVQPALEQLGLWLATNLPVAIQALVGFWNGTLLPAFMATGVFITGTVIPALSQVWTWLSTNIPAAIQTVSGFWNGVLLPALQAVGNWINTYLVPAFMALDNFIGAVLNVAVTAMAGLWQNVLYPALLTVYNFLAAQLTPSLTATGNVISAILGPAVELFVAGALVAFQQGLQGIQNALTWVTNQLNSLTNALNNVTLPDWLQPGSPTPFEIGLRGIADILQGKLAKALEVFSATAPAAFKQLADSITQIKTDLSEMADTTLVMFGEAMNAVGSASASAFEVLNSSVEDALDAVEDLDDTLGGIASEARSAANAFDSFQDAGSGIYNTLIPALQALVEWLNNVADAAADAAENIGAVGGAAGAAGGPGFQAGANFVVPSGFPRDSFPFRAETGERVIVIPKAQAAAGGGMSVTVNFGDVAINNGMDLAELDVFIQRSVIQAIGA